MLVAVAISAHLASCAGVLASQPESKGLPPKGELPGRIAEVLWWLPADTQTVRVAQGPLKLGVPPTPRAVPDDVIEMAFPDMVQPLYGVRKGAYTKALSGREVALSVCGGRRFRPPLVQGEGAVWDGAYVFIFREELGPLGESLMRSLREGADTKEEIAGHQVVMFKDAEEFVDPWRTYVALPRPDVLVVATDRDYLREVLARMARRAKTRALPDHFPEWKYLDPSARYWGIRHYYDRDDGMSDPFAIEDRGVGLVFTAMPGAGRFATVRYFTHNEEALTVAKTLWRATEFRLLGERRSGLSVVEISLAREDRDKFSHFFFLAICALGYGVYP